MTKNCILSERPHSAIQLQYHALTRGVKFDDIIIADDTDSEFEALRRYSETNFFVQMDAEQPFFGLHFVDEPNDAGEVLEDIEPDILAIDTPSTILDAEVIGKSQIGTVNAHGAVLPEYRGYGSLHWAVLYGDRVGASAHLVNEDVDAGPVLATRELDLSRFDSMLELINAVYYECTFQVMIDGIFNLKDADFEPEPQRAENGKQYFDMHPKLKELTERVIKKVIDESCRHQKPK